MLVSNTPIRMVAVVRHGSHQVSDAEHLPSGARTCMALINGSRPSEFLPLHSRGYVSADLAVTTILPVGGLRAEAQAASREDGIDPLVLGCAGMARVVREVRAAVTIPVIDPVATAAGCMGWLSGRRFSPA